ncbi:MAG: hypothetical protein H0X33_12860 [Taibaiella sp.]|nr:hypothetical protein [Taibaiella sp.]
MKKQSLLFVAGMIALASCNSGGNQNTTTQAQVDSMANVKAMELQTQMQAKNDSIVNALAKAKADSMELATRREMGATTASSSTHHRTERHTGTATPVATPAPPPSSQSKWNQNNTNTNNPNNSNQPTQTSKSKWGN